MTARKKSRKRGRSTKSVGARKPGAAAPPRKPPTAAPATPATAPAAAHVLPRTEPHTEPPAAVAPPPPTAPPVPAKPTAAPEPPRPPRPPRPPARPGRARTPEAAFDALYLGHASDLLRQVELLTGDPLFARQSVIHAYDQAWQRWPEVARDGDPAGWIRAVAYEYALAPWQHWVPGHRPHPLPPPGPLEAALLDLPPAQRRALLLYDGLGLDLPEAAAEVESSTAAAAGRIIRARETLTAAVRELADVADVPVRLGALLDAEPAPEPPGAPARVRDTSERGVRRRTAGAFALTGLIALATTVTVAVGPGPLADRGPGQAGPHPSVQPAAPGLRTPGRSGAVGQRAAVGQHNGADPPPPGERAHAVTR